MDCRKGTRHTGVVGYQIRNPIIPNLAHFRIFRVKIGQRDRVIAQPALFDIGLIVIIRNQTVGVKEGW